MSVSRSRLRARAGQIVAQDNGSRDVVESGLTLAPRVLFAGAMP